MYPYPSTAAERQEIQEGLSTRIQDLYTVSGPPRPWPGLSHTHVRLLPGFLWRVLAVTNQAF